MCLEYVKRIERFHSRDQRPYCFTEIKDDFCIKIEFNRGVAWFFEDVRTINNFF